MRSNQKELKDLWNLFKIMLCFFKLSLPGKLYFLFPDVLKRWSLQKNRALIWSFLYYRERWYFFFPKIWSYTLDRKWKMIFLKKINGNMIFSSNFLKSGLCKKSRAGTWSFLHYLEERWYFFPENIFFHWAETEGRSFSRNIWKYDIFCIHVHVQTSKMVLFCKNTPKGDWRSRLTS